MELLQSTKISGLGAKAEPEPCACAQPQVQNTQKCSDEFLKEQEFVFAWAFLS